jgi:hypothetical protein
LEFKQAFEIVYFAGEFGIFIEPAFVQADFALYAFSAFGVIPEAWIKGF